MSDELTWHGPNNTPTQRDLINYIRPLVGARGTMKILNGMKRRMKALAREYGKDHFVSTDDFMKMVDEEVTDWMRDHPPKA